MTTVLDSAPISKRELEGLKPLLEGKPVAFSIRDPHMRLKKRMKFPVLLIAPVGVYDLEGSLLLLSIPGYGSEVIEPTKVKATQLYRLGLTMTSSKLLSVAINQLYKDNSGEINDNT